MKKTEIVRYIFKESARLDTRSPQTLDLLAHEKRPLIWARLSCYLKYPGFPAKFLIVTTQTWVLMGTRIPGLARPAWSSCCPVHFCGGRSVFIP